MKIFVHELPREIRKHLISKADTYTAKKNILCEKISNLHDMGVCSFKETEKYRKL